MVGGRLPPVVALPSTLQTQAQVEELLRAAANGKTIGQHGVRRAIARLAGEQHADSLIAGAAERLLLRDSGCDVHGILDTIQSIDPAIHETTRVTVARAVAAEIATDGLYVPPRPRLLEALQQLVGRRWLQPSGVVAIVEELATTRQAEADGAEPRTRDAEMLPPCIHLLEAVAEVTQAPDLYRSLVHAPQTCALLLQNRSCVAVRCPQLAAALASLQAATLGGQPFDTRGHPTTRGGQSVGAATSASDDGNGSSDGAHVIFEAIEDVCCGLGGGESRGGQPSTAYCLLPTYLPPADAPVPTMHGQRQGPFHSGILLAGMGGVVEEWDLDAGLRLDQLRVDVDVADEEGVPVAVDAVDGPNVVALMAPSLFAQSGEPDEVIIAAANDERAGAGLAVLRRDSSTLAWQLEAPWPPERPPAGWRELAKISRGEFLHGSLSLLAVGQTSAIGGFEIGLYDATMAPAKPLAVCSEHTDLVPDVCALSAQTFASVSLDGSLLLWDIRVGLKPIAGASFDSAEESGAPASVPQLSAVAACRANALLLCGSLGGELFLFDVRSGVSRPLLRPPPVHGAVARVRLWEECRSETVCQPGGGAPPHTIAAVLSSEEGLCSYSFRGGGTGAPMQARRGSCREGALHGSAQLPARLFFDVARLHGTAGTFFACGEHGVTRFRTRSGGLEHR